MTSLTTRVPVRIIAAEALNRARDAVAPAMRSVVARLDATNAAITSYHLGWTDTAGTPTPDAAPNAGGKAVRAGLAVLSAHAAGAATALGLPGAVAVELVHNFSLVHDDVLDGDIRRRHRPTVWAVWGAGSAILTGDALLALAHEVLLEGASPHRLDAARMLARATRHLIHGQVLDMAFEQRADVTLQECLDMVAGKTGALLSSSAAIGAVLAGAAEPVVQALSTFGAQLGVAFQLIDDLLGIWGDPASTGKPVFSDLRAHKKTLPVTYALTHGGSAGAELADWLTAPGRTAPEHAGPGADRADGKDGADDEDRLRRGADLVEAAGGRDWAAAEARRRITAATRALAAVPIPDTPRRQLTAIAHFVVDRET